MWPEIMAQGYDETINYGLSGVGNFFIFSKFIYLYNTKNLGPNDTVIIQWTEPARFDYINPNEKEWAREGSASAEKFIRPEIEQLNSDPTTYYKTLTYMQTIINMLKSKGCKWYFFFISWESMVPKIGVEESFRGAYQNSTQVNYDTMLDIVNTHTDKHFVDEVSMVEYINPMFDGNNLICQSVDVDGSLVEFVDGHPTPVYFYQYIRDVITYQIDCNEDYNRRLFHQFDTLFEQLYKRNIVVNYIFNEETPWCDELLKYGNKIKFDNGFVNWLYSKDYHKEEECHYTRGVQELIYDEIIKQMVFYK
jgi:hypothetical protein